VTARKFIQANLGTWTVTEMAALLGASACAYYKWAKHGTSSRRLNEDARLLELIRGIVERHKRRYGSPRVSRELRELHGQRVSQKRAARLMRENGLNARRGVVPPADDGFSLRERTEPRLQRGRAGPEVGFRHHVPAGAGRLAVPDGGSGPARPQGRRLGVQRPDGRRGDGGGRAWDGDQKQALPARPDIPFGQGLAVMLACLPRCSAGGLPWRPPKHEPQGRALGQRVRGALFRDAEAGA